MPWNFGTYQPRADQYGAAYHGALERSHPRSMHVYRERDRAPETRPRESRRSNLHTGARRRHRANTRERPHQARPRIASEAARYNRHRSSTQCLPQTEPFTQDSTNHGQRVQEPDAGYRQEASPSRSFLENMYRDAPGSLPSINRPSTPARPAAPPSRSSSGHPPSPTRPSERSSVRSQVDASVEPGAPAPRSCERQLRTVRFDEMSALNAGTTGRQTSGRNRHNELRQGYQAYDRTGRDDGINAIRHACRWWRRRFGSNSRNG